MLAAFSILNARHAYQDRVFGELHPTLVWIVSALVNDAHLNRWHGDDPESDRLDKLASKLAKCCASPIVYGVDDPETPILVEARCKSRLCPRCSRIRAAKLINDLRFYAGLIDSPRFLTLTLQSSDHNLRDQLLHMRKSFAKLRKSKLWKAHVTGGIYTIEVTYNRRRRQWHPHIHAIIDGTFMPQADIVTAWQKASNGSIIVDIRACHSRGDAVNYLASYIAKSSDAEKLPQGQVPEWAVNVHGLRFVARFGTLHKAVLPSAELRESISGTSLICSAEHLAAASDDGDREAGLMLSALRANPPRHLPDGEPRSPEVLASDDGSLAIRLRTWDRLRSEFHREQHKAAQDPEFKRRFDDWAEWLRKKRARARGDPVLPYGHHPDCHP